MIFVFGSNREGRHEAGAALNAVRFHGAKYCFAGGRQGGAYAIVTKEIRSGYPPVSPAEVREGVDRFLAYAHTHPDLEFQVTKIGCGLAGFTEEQISLLFAGAPLNCDLPEGWSDLGRLMLQSAHRAKGTKT